MKKICLTPVHQKNHIFYTMVADPREIVTVMKRAEADAVQENQRPWSKKKVQEIVEYVMGYLTLDKKKYKVNGLIPNAPIINLIGKFEIQHDDNDTPYLLFPETEEELNEFKNQVEFIDGNHRILAFAPDLRDPLFSDDTPYEMIFSVFFKLTEDEKKELFMVTNEKQTKIEDNLLRLMRKMLCLLGDNEKYFDLVNKMNIEEVSPLKGRIMIGASKVKRGYREKQLSTILEKSDAYSRLEAENFDTITSKCKLLSTYLKAWENVYKVSFQNPSNSTLTKISGIRYIMYLLPAFFDILREQDVDPTDKSFKDIIQKLPLATGISDVFTDPTTSLAFRGGGATVKLAKEHKDMLVKYATTTKTKRDFSERYK